MGDESLIQFTQSLIRAESVTPHNAGAIELVQDYCENLGFKGKIYSFGDGDTGKNARIHNLYTQYGTGANNLCFAGHTDVVPVGDASAWRHDPFAGNIVDGVMYGRGVSDMKGAIAAWCHACDAFIKQYPSFNGALSLLITGDEESHAINGTKLLLPAITRDGFKLSACLTGEPTNPKILGEMIKLGRRGSLNITLTTLGVQGHTGYPHLADNAAHHMVDMLKILQGWVIDAGNDFFEPSCLSVSTIDINNPAGNIIPARATAKINIRFNNIWHSESLIAHITQLWAGIDPAKYIAEFSCSGESFLTERGHLSQTITNAIAKVYDQSPDKSRLSSLAELSTTGGTSDSRFIKDYCPVLDFGLINATIHQVNECAHIEDIINLSKIYYETICGYFKV